MISLPTRTHEKSSGFVGVVFLAIALIGVVIAALAAMSRGNPSGVGAEANSSTASIVIKQGSDLKNAFAQLLVDPGLRPQDITFDMNASTGLFSPGFKVAAIPLPPPTALTTSGAGTLFAYNRRVFIPGLGSDLRYDFVAVLGNVRLDVCQAINRNLYSDALTAPPAVSGSTQADWTDTATQPTVDDTTKTATNYVGRPEGCVASSDGKYMYYKVLGEDAAITTEVDSASGGASSSMSGGSGVGGYGDPSAGGGSSLGGGL